MAVENLIATLRGPGELSTTTRHVRGLAGSVQITTVSVEVTAAASDTSTYLLARLPSDARIHPQSIIALDDLASTGSPTLDIGTYDASDGTTADVDAINDGIDLATASTGLRMIKNPANWGKQLWELAGCAADPGGFINVKGVMDDADTNTGGTLSASIVWTRD